MNPRGLVRNALCISVAAGVLAACGASAVRLREDHASGDGWKRDFRMTAELGSLPKGSSYEVKVQSLDDLLAQEMTKTPICAKGYQVTKHGADGVRYWFVEGVCS